VPLCRHGDAQQKERWLRGLTAGQLLGAFCLTEAEAGSDVLGIATTAQRKGDDYLLSGRKLYITNAGPHAADLYLVFARTADEAARGRTLSAFLLERGTPGLSFGPPERKMGLRGVANCDVVLDGCRVPAAQRLGEEGQGFRIAMETLDGGRIGIAALAVGLAQGALELATAWAKERRQFGRPIAEFQATQFKLADMITRIEAARLLTLRAAWLQDEGKPFSAEAAMAKLSASETAMWVTTQTVQILGGRGYTKRSPAERMMRDAKICEIFEGTSEVQRIVIAAHHLAS
jgi:acyl-CoA dehydrogenase